MDRGMVIRRLYPNADPLRDYKVVREAGDTESRLVEWDEAKLGPRPTDQQLQDAWIPALKVQKTAEVRRRAVRESEKVMPVYELVYLVRNRIADSRLTTLDALAKKGRDMEAWINDPARTEAQLTTVSWDTWV